jgi:antitoxin VapB
MAKTAKIFWTGRSQAVRLPKKFRMDGEEVRIRKQGVAVVLESVVTDWAWLDSIQEKFSEDFLAAGRNQPPHQIRPALDTAFE